MGGGGAWGRGQETWGMLVIVVQPIEAAGHWTTTSDSLHERDSWRSSGVRGFFSGGEACGGALLLVDCCAASGSQQETVTTVGSTFPLLKNGDSGFVPA